MTPPPLSDNTVSYIVMNQFAGKQLAFCPTIEDATKLAHAIIAARDAQWKKALGEPVAFVGNWGKVEFYEGVFPQLGGKLYAFNQEK